MFWEVKPNYNEYDLFDGAIIFAESKEEAENIANNNEELINEYNSWAWKNNEPQIWTAKPLSKEKGVVFTSFNAG